MRNKNIVSIIVVLIISVMIKTDYGYGQAPEFIDISIGSYTVGTEVDLKSKGGLGIYDRANRVLYKDIGENEAKLVIIEKDLGELRSLSGDGVYYLDLNDGIIGSITGEPIFINGIEYRGCLGFTHKKTGKLLSHVPIDYYLYGVLPKEMGASFPTEALKAQAVASRSYAITNMNKHQGEGFNLCNTTHCQVYGGVAGENPKTNDIVDATSNLCIRHNGQVAEGVFSSNNGGYVESAKGAWGGDVPYLKSKDDVFSKNTVNSNWTVEYSNAELNNKLKNAGVNVGNLLDIRVNQTTDGNRVMSIDIIGSDGQKTITGSKFRTILGNTELKSTFFDVRKPGSLNNELYVKSATGKDELDVSDIFVVDANYKAVGSDMTKYKVEGSTKDVEVDLNGLANGSSNFIIKGKGYGHGVGMSQYGAKVMAEEGYNFVDILQHYYDGVEVY